MKKSVLTILVNIVLLNGCNEDSLSISGPSIEVPDIGEPEKPDPIKYHLSIASSGITIGGAKCDGVISNQNGQLTYHNSVTGEVGLDYDSETIPNMISCSVGNTPLGSFEKGKHYLEARSGALQTIKLDLNKSSINEYSKDAQNNIKNMLLALDVDGNSIGGIQLNSDDQKQNAAVYHLYELHYNDALNRSEEDFKTNNLDVIKDQGEADKQPGHGSNIVPEFTPGDSDVSSGGLVSANAESAYKYVPAQPIPETSRLMLEGSPVAGINYYGPNYRGVTDSEGTFNYNWGETVTFSIEALTLGEAAVKGLDIELKQLSKESIVRDNIETLIKQFDDNKAAPWVIDEKVHSRFAQESNNIVEKISLSLANGQAPEGQSEQEWGKFPSVENEFLAQFLAGGSAWDIVSDLKIQVQQQWEGYNYSSYQAAPVLSPAQELKIMMGQSGGLPVTQFHVFAEQRNGYLMPSPRAATFINISNLGAPVVMPRSDANAAIPFGGLAIKDKFGRPFAELVQDLVSAPTFIDMANKTYWNPKEIQEGWHESSFLVNKQTGTFGLPFVVTGKIGQGRLLVLGNSLYNSILVNPSHYSNVNKDLVNSHGVSDGQDMFNFMVNSFEWLAGDRAVNIATNRKQVYFAQRDGVLAKDLNLAPEYLARQWTLQQQELSGLDSQTTPIYLLQAYPIKNDNPDALDIENPLITEDDVNALIDYVNQGGNVVIMESLTHKTLPVLGRLLDTAGISAIGRGDEVGPIVKMPETFRINPNPENGQSATPPNSSRPVYDENVYVLEGLSFSSDSGDIPSADNPPEKGYYYDQATHTYHWGEKSHESKTVLRALFRPSSVRNSFYKEAQATCGNGAEANACIERYLEQKVTSELAAWKADVKKWYSVEECSNNQYDYELDCIETRKGNGIPLSRTIYQGANDMVSLFKRLEMSSNVSDAMIAAANMGTNLKDLYQHELYYRTKGRKGTRLSSVDVERIYGNLSAWMWNDYQYRFDGGDDNFGHKHVVEILNCYSNDLYGNPESANASEFSCPAELKAEMIEHGFLVSPNNDQQYVLNPSYPLNYLEKPFTRMLLGRSYFDAPHLDRSVGVDVRQYPGVPTIGAEPSTMTIHQGSRQSTGVWAKAREKAYVYGLSADDSVMIAMADNLTGRVNHEMALKRPPRVSISLNGAQAGDGFVAPYGGLIYVTLASGGEDNKLVSFGGAVQNAPMYKMTSATTGEWVTSPSESDAPLTEIVANRFVYTTTTAGVKNHSDAEILTMAKQLDLFTLSANEFYGRDEIGGIHDMYTDSEKPYINMRIVDDAQISIGAAHSGYPVMVDRFPRGHAELINASTNWLVGHEIGHNLAANWFNVPGAGETANNLLALYNQERNLGEMPRIATTITTAPEYVKNNNHPWADGSNADRLNFFGQLKIWAESNFEIDQWETPDRLALPRSIYNQDANGHYDEGWNFIKLVHRKAREGFDDTSDNHNYCSAEIKSDHGLTSEGMLMVCSSYLTGVDLSDFFNQWNVGESKQTIAHKDHYSGGVKNDANAQDLINAMKTQRLLDRTPVGNPLQVNATRSSGELMLPQEPYWM